MKLFKKLLGVLIDFPVSIKLRVYILRKMGYKIGKGTRIAKGFYVSDRSTDKHNVILGDRVNIASNVTVITTSSPNTAKLHKIFPLKFAPVIIGDDVWIGTGTIILPGVTIGKYSIIGAGLVIEEDIPPYSFVKREKNHIQKLNNYLIKKLEK